MFQAEIFYFGINVSSKVSINAANNFIFYWLRHFTGSSLPHILSSANHWAIVKNEIKNNIYKWFYLNKSKLTGVPAFTFFLIIFPIISS